MDGTEVPDASGMDGAEVPQGGMPEPPLLPVDSAYCNSLRQTIQNIQRELMERYEDYRADAEGTRPDGKHLPGKCKGDKLHEHPRRSRRGHWNIINKLKADLAKRQAAYASRCLRPAPEKVSVPVPAPPICSPKTVKCVKVVVVTGGGIGCGYVIYRVCRMVPSVAFPPLWPTIVPNAVCP